MEKTPKVNAIAFDFIGVLLDFKPFDHTELQWAIRQYFGHFITDEAHLEFYEKHLNMPREAIIEEIRTICNQAYLIREPDILEKIPPFKFAAATNHLSYMMDWFKSQEMSKKFQVLLASGSLGLAKPDPRYFLTLCDALDEQPEHVLFVDDTYGHIASAKACGLQGLHFIPGRTLSEEVNRYLETHGA